MGNRASAVPLGQWHLLFIVARRVRALNHTATCGPHASQRNTRSQPPVTGVHGGIWEKCFDTSQLTVAVFRRFDRFGVFREGLGLPKGNMAGLQRSWGAPAGGKQDVWPSLPAIGIHWF